MANLTIELDSELTELLRAEARRRGQDEQQLARELLAAELATQDVPTPYPAIAPNVQKLLATMSDQDMLVPPARNAEAAHALFDAWNTEDATGEVADGDESWDEVLQAIDASRGSPRKLFGSSQEQL